MIFELQLNSTCFVYASVNQNDNRHIDEDYFDVEHVEHVTEQRNYCRCSDNECLNNLLILLIFHKFEIVIVWFVIPRSLPNKRPSQYQWSLGNNNCHDRESTLYRARTEAGKNLLLYSRFFLKIRQQKNLVKNLPIETWIIEIAHVSLKYVSKDWKYTINVSMLISIYQCYYQCIKFFQ